MRPMVISCKFCSSTTIVKSGMRNSVQIYKCKICKHRFFENHKSLVRMRTPTQVIVTALNMYFDGFSVRKVSLHIAQIFGEKNSQVAVWNWIQKYSKLVSEYVQTLQPSLSGKYHHDETEIKVGGDGRYFWETLDRDTRFIVAHLLTENRTSEEAKKVFKQALDKQRPSVLFTDGSFEYDDAFNKVFYSNFRNKKVEWIRKVGIKARETNNIVERLHGTFKDRYKPMRGLKKEKTAQTLMDGYVTYYNFCRKHQTIGKTPAEVAGLEVRGWNELIQRAQTQKTQNELKTQELEVEIINE